MTSSPPPARLRPFRPVPFGRYTLLSHLATGGMGELYLARMEGAEGFEKLYVIKKILPHLVSDPDIVERFVGEAKTGGRLHHGSIAQVLELGMQDGDPFIVLEYVDGKDLRKVAARMRERQQTLPLTFTLWVMSRVLDALAYAHRKSDDEGRELQLIHRDVSPQNVLISYEGEVKVIDFGLAKSRLSLAKTHPSVILGKFLYMAPEQARHQPADRRSDLYAAGLCLFELITGRNPFAAVHPGELMSAVANPKIPPLREVDPLTPPSVAQLVSRALAPEPAARFQTAEEFRGRLLACLLDVDPSSGPENVSKLMRELFSAEYATERRLLAGWLRTASAPGQPLLRAAPSSEPVPLSFSPTPRTRERGAAPEDGETRPGVMPDEATRPGVTRDRAWPSEPSGQETEAVVIPQDFLLPAGAGDGEETDGGGDGVPPTPLRELSWEAPPGELTPPPVKPPPKRGGAALPFRSALDPEALEPVLMPAPPHAGRAAMAETELTPVGPPTPSPDDTQPRVQALADLESAVPGRASRGSWSLEPAPDAKAELAQDPFDAAHTLAVRVPVELMAQIERSGEFPRALPLRRARQWPWGWMLLGAGFAITLLLVWISELTAPPPAHQDLAARSLQPIEPPPEPLASPAPPEPAAAALPEVAPADGEAPLPPPEPLAGEEDLLAPLTPEATSAPARKPVPRPAATPLQAEWERTRALFQSTTRLIPCEDRRMALLCTRYGSLQEAVRAAGTASPTSLVQRLRSMQQDLAQKREEAL